MSSKRPEYGRRDKGSMSALIDERNFLEAIRDAGYRTAAAALAELVDNAIEAGASAVSIDITTGADLDFPVQVAVTDDGCGMSLRELELSLMFGGSSRFGSRHSFGRFGMGLPSASLSLARDVEVRSWRGNSLRVARLSLDADRVEAGRVVRTRRVGAGSMATLSGTTVLLRSCDRLGYERVGWLSRSIASELGRVFRRQIQAGIRISVNGKRVAASNHLLLGDGATPYGDELVYELDGPGGTGRVRVQFSELPVLRWATLTPAEKSALGITGAKPISVLRAGREIDRGWWFMGSKRRENYDSWWRCEVDFEPTVDDWFGVSYTKQDVRPSTALTDLLTPDLEAIARSMNSRIRRQFELVTIADPVRVAERTMRSALSLLPGGVGSIDGKTRDVRVALGDLDSSEAFQVSSRHSVDTVTLNVSHPLVRDLYAPLAASDLPATRLAAARVVLLALSEALMRPSDVPAEARVRDWSRVVATFLERCS